MTKVKELASRYGLSTADSVPPPRSGDDAWGSGLPPLKLTPEQLAVFKRLRPCALCLVGTDGPVSVTLWDPASGNVVKRLGHNRGVWPMRVAKTTSPADTVTNTYNKSPFVYVGTQVRLWLDSEDHFKRLAPSVGELLAYLSEQAMGAGLFNNFVDLGADLQLEVLEGKIAEKARRYGWACRTDDELVAWLERLRREDHLLAEIEGRR